MSADTGNLHNTACYRKIYKKHMRIALIQEYKCEATSSCIPQQQHCNPPERWRRTPKQYSDTPRKQGAKSTPSPQRQGNCPQWPYEIDKK